MYGYFKIPNGVLYIAEGILADARNEYEIYEIYRLFHHPRIGDVWKELLAKKRGMPGVYMHPPVGGAVSIGGPEYAQQLACANVFSFLFYAVCNPVQVSKWDEEEECRKKVQQCCRRRRASRTTSRLKPALMRFACVPLVRLGNFRRK
jgi:hypothetical protein